MIPLDALPMTTFLHSTWWLSPLRKKVGCWLVGGHARSQNVSGLKIQPDSSQVKGNGSTVPIAVGKILPRSRSPLNTSQDLGSEQTQQTPPDRFVEPNHLNAPSNQVKYTMFGQTKGDPSSTSPQSSLKGGSLASLRSTQFRHSHRPLLEIESH